VATIVSEFAEVSPTYLPSVPRIFEKLYTLATASLNGAKPDEATYAKVRAIFGGALRTAGTGADQSTAVFAASGADVVQVMREGVVIASPDDRRAAGAELDRVVSKLWEVR